MLFGFALVISPMQADEAHFNLKYRLGLKSREMICISDFIITFAT